MYMGSDNMLHGNEVQFPMLIRRATLAVRGMSEVLRQGVFFKSLGEGKRSGLDVSFGEKSNSRLVLWTALFCRFESFDVAVL